MSNSVCFEKTKEFCCQIGRDKMLGALIGKGNTADVFDIGRNKILKLFKAGYPLNSVRKEYENSKLLNLLDISIVKSYELLTYGERYGIIYDRVDGESMLSMLLQTQDLEKYATALASLHKKVLSHHLPSAVSLKSILKRNIERTDELSTPFKSKLITVLDTLPDGDCFCHGDFHFDNVIVSKDNYYIIDYMNVCRGHAYGDIARTVYLTEMTPTPPKLSEVNHIRHMKRQITDIYLKEMGVSRECLSDWLSVISAARLSELSNEQIDERKAILEYLT